MRDGSDLSDRAYVLHSRRYRESSAIVDFFTERNGRVAAVARGLYRARGGRSDQAALCQPLQALQIRWLGHRELKTLVSIERAAAGCQTSGEALYAMLYCNELLTRLLAYHDPLPGLFAAYERLLAEVDSNQCLEPALRNFEMCLLSELGYALELNKVAETGAAVDPACSYRYVIEHGLELAAGTTDQEAFPGAELLAIHDGELDQASTQRAAKKLLRQVLHSLLGGRPLASRELFR